MAQYSFGADSTADEVLQVYGSEISGRNVLVTGASAGIGAESARAFALAGAQVWLAGRDISKTQAVVDSIKALVADPNKIHFIELDLSSFLSIEKCISNFLSLNLPLHVLLNNAGCWLTNSTSPVLTTDGLEMHFGTNHIGTFLLTNGLLPALKLAVPSRIVNVASLAHRRSGISFEDPNFTTTKNPYSHGNAYGQSKTANMLHAVELSNRYSVDGITAVSLHPGVIETELWRNGTIGISMNKTVPQGAATSVFCAVSPTIVSGQYYSDCKLSDYTPYAMDPENAKKLWILSEELTKSNK